MKELILPECNKCGKCCEAIVLNHSRQEIESSKNFNIDAKFILENWVEISNDEAITINPKLKTFLNKRNVYTYKCLRYDKVSKLCTCHEEKPNVCSKYPLYGRKDFRKGEFFYSDNCVYSKIYKERQIMTTKEQFNQLRTFINEMNSTNSTKEKEIVLKKYMNNVESEDPFITLILIKTYNPFINFYITSENCEKHKDLEEGNHDSIFHILLELSDRNITGNKAIMAVNSFVSKHEEFKDIIYSILDKNLKIRIDSKIINKVYKAKFGVNLIKEFNVALANSYDEKLANKIDFTKEDWYVSRKLDGCRCITIIDDNGNINCYSREGKEFKTLEVLKEKFKNFPSGYVFDGEICLVDEKGNENFSDIMKQITRKNHQIQNPKYLLFDVLTLNDFYEQKSREILSVRNERLKRMVKEFELKNDTSLEVLEQNNIEDKYDLEAWKEVAAEMNWEGLIIRKDTFYNGKRSNDMLKVKEFKDAEYKVLDIKTGEMRVINESTGLEETITTMTNVVIEHKGNLVSVGSGFSLEQRKYYFEHPNELLNKIITVKYFQESTDKTGKISLRFPTVKCIHGKEREV